MLLALVLDRAAGHPDNAAATARLLGVDRETVRRHRAELIARGLVRHVDGFLVATGQAADLLRLSDPLPRALLRGASKRLPLPTLRAAAVVYSDAVGWRAERRGCRSDDERATVANVSRPTVRKARTELAARGLVTVESIQRGRADLRRARLTDDRKATHGAPLSQARADRLAQAAARGRRGAVQIASGGAVPIASPMQEPSAPIPMQALAAPAADGVASLPKADGGPEGRTVTAATTRRHEVQPVADILRRLAPSCAPAAADLTAAARERNDEIRGRLRRLSAADLERLRCMPVERGIAQVLAIADVDAMPDGAGKRLETRLAERNRRRVAMLVAAGRTADDALAIVADVALSGARSIAAVVASRTGRMANRAHAVRDILTRCRRDRTAEQMLAELRGESVAPAVMPATGPAPATNAHELRVRGYLVEAVRAGDWRRVARRLGDSAVREVIPHGREIVILAAWTGIAAADIERNLAAASSRRATA